jgi:transcriptional regulator with XRE-family HTH domain
MKYGKAIRICRAARGLSQKELATKVGLDSSHISLIEAEKRSPRLETIEKIAKSLDVPLHLLMLLASEQKDVATRSLTNVKDLSQVFLELLLEGDPSEKKKKRAG